LSAGFPVDDRLLPQGQARGASAVRRAVAADATRTDAATQSRGGAFATGARGVEQAEYPADCLGPALVVAVAGDCRRNRGRVAWRLRWVRIHTLAGGWA